MGLLPYPHNLAYINFAWGSVLCIWLNGVAKDIVIICSSPHDGQGPCFRVGWRDSALAFRCWRPGLCSQVKFYSLSCSCHLATWFSGSQKLCSKLSIWWSERKMKCFHNMQCRMRRTGDAIVLFSFNERLATVSKWHVRHHHYWAGTVQKPRSLASVSKMNCPAAKRQGKWQWVWTWVHHAVERMQVYIIWCGLNFCLFMVGVVSWRQSLGNGSQNAVYIMLMTETVGFLLWRRRRARSWCLRAWTGRREYLVHWYIPRVWAISAENGIYLVSKWAPLSPGH